MAQIKTLDDIQVVDVAAFGSKCATLATLHQADYKVPFAFGISAEVYRKQVGPTLANFELDKWQLLDSQSRAAQAEEIRQAILRHVELGYSATREMRKIIAQSPLATGEVRVAVRSSATVEDSPHASFAGQMESYLNVAISNVEEYIVRCWSSLWLPRAVSYRHRNKMPPQDAAMAVLLQHQLVPDAAGVMFTVDPLKPQERAVIIEAVRGLGVVLVQGEVAPDKYRVRMVSQSRLELDSVETGSQQYVLQPGPRSGELQRAALSPQETKGQVLSDGQITQLAEIGLRIASFLGSPQDIEWALCQGQFYILQSRPVTTVTEPRLPSAQGRYGKIITRIRLGDKTSISPPLRQNDKVRLRLIADTHNLHISPGWLIQVGEEFSESEESLPGELTSCGQVSMVLLDPPRLHGNIHRRFSTGAGLEEEMERFIESVRTTYSSFTFIITEIYYPTLSGIAKMVGNDMVTEVAFGSYIPKGVADTSLYVVDANYEAKTAEVAHQEEAVYIVDGKPQKVMIDQQPTLSDNQLRYLYDATLALQDHYPNATLEYGIDRAGRVYLIDIIEERASTGLALENVKVMSRGRVVGKALRVTTEDMLWDSLDAHFHSQRLAGAGGGEHEEYSSMIVVATRPYLSLEDFLIKVPPDSIGFVFERGSILGHLAIILREYGIPGVISPEMFSRIQDGDTVVVDTTQQDGRLVWISTETSNDSGGHRLTKQNCLRRREPSKCPE